MNGFSLIETMLWENGEYFLLGFHMERLEKSARYFSFDLDRAAVENALMNAASSLDASKRYRSRLLLEHDGAFRITSDLLEDRTDGPVKAAVSDKRTDKSDVFYRHKTTNRPVYETELAKYRAQGFFDVIFLNRDGEVTEGAVTNIVIKKDREYFTPPLSCGLLAGTYREYLLRSGKIPLKEKVLRAEDLQKADGILLVNSVRKMMEARIAL